MKPPITYYGGKQKLVSVLLPMFPVHTLYAEPFAGGAAVLFAKERSGVEVINDTNAELINFYKVMQRDFVSLQSEVQITLHSRRQHKDASIVYNNSHLFNELKRAWAVWVLAQESFASMIDGSWGYDKAKSTTSKKIANKVREFTHDYAIRLQNVQIECADAVYIIKSRDCADAFFYVDPPYFNAHMGHYGGYTEADFERLLQALAGIKGKFLLSSYPSDVLERYRNEYGWGQKSVEQYVSVNNVSGRRGKPKVEVMTYNYDLPIL
ncbi:DNA adenine methylase [bacterium]|nr:DNA adenine methylase [bacterium]